MAANLISYVPGVLQEVREFKAITTVENPEIDNLSVSLGLALNNQFIGYLDNYGCSRWETMLAIKPLDTDTLQERNFRILARVNEQLPYTYRSLEERLADLCGKDGYSIVMDKAKYILNVRIAQSAKKNFSAVAELLDRITPCNLILSISLLYNTHNMVGGFTHNQLSAYTYGQIREEENL
ncbi:YmfQ family protein [Lachnoclostridium phytofermentans]|uniref:DUF2313 domain-containing protein n=1 Tax=Lachnoclostridium phytofermentans (strain ATCC 700394 / DSM 18823 / ISDg) TaxID=357809 RepID=A9KPN2_LACP7|nr:YmfQ family protein [Lachnoclostridium phytofermentans]ABX43306.1 hypothetical protein Cphy_2949 [Lachnoclostridium phytofermentans ISDg]